MPRARYAFLDQEGTLVDPLPRSVDPAVITLAPGVASLASLAAAGFRFAVIADQPGDVRSLFPERALLAAEDRLADLLADVGIEVDDFLYCPRRPEGGMPGWAVPSACGKPEPGLLLRAARLLGADLRRSWMIGGTLDDVEAGHRAGCRSALVNNGGETEWVLTHARRPDIIGRDLVDVVEEVLAAESGLVMAGHES